IRRVVFDAMEGVDILAFGIFQTNAIAVAALDGVEAETANLNGVVRIECNFASGSVRRDGHFAGLQGKSASYGRAVWQGDLVGGVFAELIGTIVQPEQSRDGKPSAFGLKLSLARTTPLGNFRSIGSHRESHPTEQNEQQSRSAHDSSDANNCSRIPANSSD